MSPQEYAEKVAAGELKDLVLSFQLREGFQMRRVMPHYLRDPRSLNHASLISDKHAVADGGDGEAG